MTLYCKYHVYTRHDLGHPDIIGLTADVLLFQVFVESIYRLLTTIINISFSN